MIVRCKKCGSDKVRMIIKGLPTKEGWYLIGTGKAETTGCCIFGDEKDAECTECGYEFYHDRTDEECEYLKNRTDWVVESEEEDS